MYTFTKLHDRRIPNGLGGVGVGVGPVELKLYAGLSDRQVYGMLNV